MAAGKKLSIEEFVERSSRIHDNKYDYSLVEYINTHTKVRLLCPFHGVFEQRPMDHLKGIGCSTCSGKKKHNTRDFVNEARAIHQRAGGQYDYSEVEYINLDTKVTLICATHGRFSILPRSVLHQNAGCIKCGIKRGSDMRRSTIEEFVARAQAVHGSNYTYERVVYVANNQKVIITCTKHGDFLQRPDNHIDGRGCPRCKSEKLSVLHGGPTFIDPPTPTPTSVRYKQKGEPHRGGYSEAWFNADIDRKLLPAQLYWVEVHCETDHFYKIGITRQTVEQRFQRTGTGKTVLHKTLIGAKYMSLHEAYIAEQTLLARLKLYQYFPNYVIDGYTECLKVDPVVESILCQTFHL